MPGIGMRGCARSVTLAGFERDGIPRGCLELHGNALALFAVTGLVNTKVQVRSAGEPGVAGKGNQVALGDEIAFIHFDAAFEQMAVMP